MTGAPGARVVAVVPARDAAASVATTVDELWRSGHVDDVVVVDDGSGDGTADAASRAGARVLRLPRNRGKGGAVAAGVRAAPDADVYLLVDADVAGTAGLATRLLAPVLTGQAEMTVAVLPGAGRKGGFGLVRRLAATGIARATGSPVRAPLSGQRAVRGDLLRSLELAPRFGLETALTIDARRAGARVVEVDVPMEHRHTGRGIAGFRHRAGQGVDIARALWPRLTTARGRAVVILASAVLIIVAALVSGDRAVPASVAATARPGKVVVFGMPGLWWSDLRSADAPTLAGLASEGAVAATFVRTLSAQPSSVEGYASVGAGTRAEATAATAGAVDLPPGSGPDRALDTGAASGRGPAVLVPAASETARRNRGRFVSSEPGALGDALRGAGRRTAVVGNADSAPGVVYRPAAAAVMDHAGVVDAGRVGPELLLDDRLAPFGRRADPAATTAEVARALQVADVVVVDAGDLDRAAAYAEGAPREQAARARRAALQATDRVLADVRSLLPDDALLLVVSVSPPGEDWRLTPMVAAGRGVLRGHLHSPSTRRVGIVTLADVGPTILDALAVPKPHRMVGHALRYRPGPVDLGHLARIDRDATFRTQMYTPVTVGYIVFQALVYAGAVAVLAGRSPGLSPIVRFGVLTAASFPLATFVFKAVPRVSALGAPALVLLVGIAVAMAAAAARARASPLSPLAWVLGATIVVLVADVATGAHLQASSLFSYAMQTAGRFTGLGNTAYTILGSATILLAAIHVHRRRGQREAVVAAAALFAVVLVVDVAPVLGADVGGILTLVPVFGLMLVLLLGRRVSWRAVALCVAVTAVVAAAALAVDLLRPPATRSHLGRLASQVEAEGWGTVSTTVARKLKASLGTYRSPWTWAVPIAALYLTYVLVVARGWARILPPRSALRAGVVTTLVLGLLGSALNDSGVVVTAVALLYLGPLLTLLALPGPPWPPEADAAAVEGAGDRRHRPVAARIAPT